MAGGEAVVKIIRCNLSERERERERETVLVKEVDKDRIVVGLRL